MNADDETYVEPDISVICDKNKLTDSGCEDAPDLAIEIVSPSSHRMDYTTKNAQYANAGVREYWIVDPLNFNNKKALKTAIPANFQRFFLFS